MIGPLLMAGLTDGSRQITANASDLAPLVSDARTEGLVSLRLLNPLETPLGTPQQYLQHSGGTVAALEVGSSNAAKMAATFRMLHLNHR